MGDDQTQQLHRGTQQRGGPALDRPRLVHRGARTQRLQVGKLGIVQQHRTGPAPAVHKAHRHSVDRVITQHQVLKFWPGQAARPVRERVPETQRLAIQHSQLEA